MNPSISDQASASLVLEESCADCRGDGGEFDALENWMKCRACDGKGVLLTQEGKAVLDFVWKHFDGIMKAVD